MSAAARRAARPGTSAATARLAAGTRALFMVKTSPLRTLRLRIRHGYAKSKAMPTEQEPDKPTAGEAAQEPASGKAPLSPAAERALAEAAERRAARERAAASPAKEVGGRGGLDPTRYGDWEKDGLASDF